MTSPARLLVRRVVVGAVLLTLVLISTGAGTTNVAVAGAAVSFTDSVTATRNHLVNGADDVVETRTIKLHVDQTADLRDRQEINVTWSGAHPTGGLVGDRNSALAADEEYPMVLMECRGVDSSSAPESKKISPATCWTGTPIERMRSETTFSWPPFRVDRYATPADRQAQVGVPSPVPKDCEGYTSGVQHWIPMIGADGTVYGGGPLGCAGIPPEAANSSSSLQPSNTTYAATDPDGTGAAQFVISTEESNATLGCSAKVPCALVAIPIIGTSCDVAAANEPDADRPPSDVADEAYKRCSATGKYLPGQPSSGFPNQEDLAVSGDLWWTASNWRNRITVPLKFAPPSNICDIANPSAPSYIYGSEGMLQATLQWGPAFCLNRSLFKFQHVVTSEVEAKSLLEARSIEAAFVGNPPDTPYSRPVVHAPVALTGFSIVYKVDRSNHTAFHSLRLTPRLLAKLLTESYPSNATVRNEYAALKNNPVDVGLDPEFQALNPDVLRSGYQREAASTLFAMSSDSDLMWALTSYINEDAEARAWLDGKADPWGMKVNPHYKKIKLPLAGWPQLDTFIPEGLRGSNGCYDASPVPWLPLVAGPVSAVSQITLNMQFDVANSQIACAHGGEPDQHFTSLGRESPGNRLLIAITTLPDADRYQLDNAALQTHVSSSAPTKFTDGSGRTFVEPTDASLRATARMLKSDDTVGTWPIPYHALRATSAGEHAYPGTMLMSVDVPTAGLKAKDAKRYAQFLRFAVGKGQIRGFGNGQLPPGYLPMTSANGLGTQAKYTTIAAAAVSAQGGGIVSVRTLKTTKPAGSSTGSGNIAGGGGDGVSIGAIPPPVTTTTQQPGPIGLPSEGNTITPVTVGKTLGLFAGYPGLTLPVVLAVTVLALLICGATLFIRRWRASR